MTSYSVMLDHVTECGSHNKGKTRNLFPEFNLTVHDMYNIFEAKCLFFAKVYMFYNKQACRQIKEWSKSSEMEESSYD